MYRPYNRVIGLLLSLKSIFQIKRNLQVIIYLIIHYIIYFQQTNRVYLPENTQKSKISALNLRKYLSQLVYIHPHVVPVQFLNFDSFYTMYNFLIFFY